MVEVADARDSHCGITSRNEETAKIKVDILLRIDILEPGGLERVLSGDAALGVQLEHAVQKVEGGRRHE